MNKQTFWDIRKDIDFNEPHAIEVLIELVKKSHIDEYVKDVLFNYLNALKKPHDRHPTCLYNKENCKADNYLYCHCLED